MNLRSKWEFGEARECRRGLLCGMGISPEEQAKPLIGIVNSWNEYNPGHVHLKALAERVKQGVRDAGGYPVEVMTTGICDGMVLKDPKYIEIPSRNSIADQVEITVDGNFFDGMVMLSTCDSIVPGQDKVGTMQDGKIDPDEYNGLIEHSWGTCGGCTSMTTANSMCMVAEALGMSLPYNSTVSAVSSELSLIAYRAGERVMELLRKGITARKIITPESIRNAIKMDMAVAASSNLILHIPAIAHEAGYDEPWWKYFDEASNEIPLLSHLAPSGPYNLHDLDLAGGLPAVLKELLPKLDGNCLTVTGKTLAENVASAQVWNKEVIHTLAEPVMKKPGIGVLYGNLAPEGAIIKIAAVPEHLFTFTGPARVFDSLHAGLDALRAGEVKPGDACVLRFMGLKGRFGTTAFTFQEELKGHAELYNSCAVITDGRFSGGTSGLSVGYVSPEAALVGPLGLVKDGDVIAIDIPNRRIDVQVDDAELARRKASFSWTFDESAYPRYLRLFVKNVGSMAHGGIWE